MINFNCPSCGKAYQLPQSVAGKNVPCNACRNSMHIPSSDSVAPKRGVNSRKKPIANVSLPAGNANVPAAQIHANNKKYIIRTLLVLGGLMLLGIGFVGGRSPWSEVTATPEAATETTTETPGPSDPSGNTPEGGEGTSPVVGAAPSDNSGVATETPGTPEPPAGGDAAARNKAADDAQKAADKKAADKKAADKMAADKKAADKKAADKKAADKKAADKKAADKKSADKKAADLASQPVVYQPTVQSNGIREEKRKDKFAPLLNNLYYHEFDLKDVSSVSPKIIAIPAADLRAQKQGWDDPGEFNVQKEEDNLWKVVRNASGLTYAYLELLPAKKQFRVYRVEVARQEGVTPFGGDNASKLDKRGDRFLSYFHLIQLNNKTYINMGLNQALEQKIGQKIAKISMRKEGVFFNHKVNQILNTMADFRLVSKPATWSITLDRIYESGIDDSTLYNAVPEIAFTGTPYITQVSGGKYSGLKCKYTDFGMDVKFDAATAQMKLYTRGSFEILVKLMDLQTMFTLVVKELKELNEAEKRNNAKLTGGTKESRAAAKTVQADITRKKNNKTKEHPYAKAALDRFITANSKLIDLRDKAQETKALVTYYRWVASTKVLAVSLKISRRQTIDGQEVEIPFWYPVLP